MPRGDYLGEFEQMVLLVVARLRGEAYGMAILEELQRRTGVEAAVASVYSALDRMERSGYVRSAVGPSTPERGGRAKRYFHLEAEGAQALLRARSALDALWEGLPVDPGALIP